MGTCRDKALPPFRRAPPKRKRAATIRKGFDYQDLVAAESLLSMVLDDDGPVAVGMENRHGGTFDDVVEYYPDRTIWKQVKWAANPLSEPFTLSGLAKCPPRRKRSLVASLAQSWRMLRKSSQAFEIQLVSNRQPDGELRSMLTGDPPRLQADLSAKDKQRLRDTWFTQSGLTATEFGEFTAALQFHLGKGALEERERDIKRDLKRLGASTGAFERLMWQIHAWSTDSSVGCVSRADVEDALGLFGETPDNRFPVDGTSLIPRDTVHASLAAIVQRSAGKYVVVLGSPGAGKSTALNTIGPRSSLAKDHLLVVYNCFTGPMDQFLRKRASAANFVRFFISEMHRLAPGRWKRRRGEPTELESMLNEAAAAVGRRQRLLVIVDGVDYANANRTDGEAALFDLLPPCLPRNVTFVVSAQAKQQLPPRLQHLDDQQYFTLPALTAAQTRRLLAQTGVFRAWSASSPYDQERISAAVHTKARGHPLVTQYLARQLLQKPGRARAAGAVINSLPDYGEDIRQWYQRLPQSADAYTRALLAEMAACPYPLTAAEANSLLQHPRDPYAAEDALRELAFLFHRQGSEWLFRHDSLRVYARDGTRTDAAPRAAHLDLLLGLPRDPRVGEYALDLAVQVGRQEWAFTTVGAAWLAQRMADGSCPSMIQRGLRRLLEDAVARRDWAHSAKWALFLERLEFELDWSIDWGSAHEVWLAGGRSNLVLRGALEGDELLVSPIGAFEMADALRSHGQHAEAEQLERVAASTPLEPPEYVTWEQFEEHTGHHIQSLATLLPVLDCTEEIERLIRDFMEQAPSPVHRPASELAPNLCAYAAFSCLWAGQHNKVLQWCARRRHRLSEEYRTLLRAAVALETRGPSASRTTVLKALKATPPLWFVAEAVRYGPFKNAGTDALAAKGRPEALFPRYFSDDSKQVVAGVRDAFDDARLSMALGLTKRIEALRAAVPSPPLFKGPLLYSLAIRVAAALPKRRTATQWRPGASEVIRCIHDSRFGSLPSHDRWNMYGVGESLVFVLGRIARIADQAHELACFATWMDEELLPALQANALNEASVVDAVLLDAYVHVAGATARDATFDRLERDRDEELRHKSHGYFHLARSAAQLGDRTQAERLLAKAFGSAITYGYRKDVTILAFTDALALLGPVLGEQLRDYTAQAAATLAVLNELTDHAELHSCASHLVSAVALAEPDLAARTAARLRTRLGGYFFDPSIGYMLRERGMDPGLVEDVFQGHGVRLDSAQRDHVDEATKASQAPLATTLDELLREHAALRSRDMASSNWERRSRVLQAILSHVNERAAFNRVKQHLAANPSERWHEKLALARRAFTIGLLTEAKALAEAAASDALNDDYWYWSEAAARLICPLAELAPDTALRTLEAAADRSLTEHPEFMGSNYVGALVVTLLRTARTEEAKHVLGVFSDYLRDLMKPYPDLEREWRALLAH